MRTQSYGKNMTLNLFKFTLEDSEEDRILDENVLSPCNIKMQFESNMFHSCICDMGRHHSAPSLKKDKHNTNLSNMTTIRFMHGHRTTSGTAVILMMSPPHI